MEYNSYKNIKYYKECAALVEGMGFKLVDLKIVPAKSITKISAIICSCDPAVNIGVNDCAKVHRVLLPRLEALLGTEETSMELLLVSNTISKMLLSLRFFLVVLFVFGIKLLLIG